MSAKMLAARRRAVSVPCRALALPCAHAVGKSLWALLAAALLFCLFQSAALAEDTILTGKVVTRVTRAEPMPFNAVVVEVLVKPGTPVTTGQPLLRYRLQDEAERMLQREVTNGAGTESLKGQVLDFERKLAETTAQRNKARQLVKSGLGSRQALARLEDDVRSLQRRIELLRVTVAKTESSFAQRLKELGGYFCQPIKEGEALPEMLVLTSPIDGYVLTLDPALNPGSMLPAGAMPVSVGQMDPMLIQVPVYEAEVSSIKEGDKAQVELPSLDNKIFEATVTEISWASSDMDVGKPSYYTVELSVPNAKLELKPGFKAVVRFGTGR